MHFKHLLFTVAQRHRAFAGEWCVPPQPALGCSSASRPLSLAQPTGCWAPQDSKAVLSHTPKEPSSSTGRCSPHSGQVNRVNCSIVITTDHWLKDQNVGSHASPIILGRWFQLPQHLVPGSVPTSGSTIM